MQLFCWRYKVPESPKPTDQVDSLFAVCFASRQISYVLEKERKIVRKK